LCNGSASATGLLPNIYIVNVNVLDQLQKLGLLPSGAKIFTADAYSMYTNICTDHAIKMISMWLDTLKSDLLEGFPLKAVKEAMEIVMRNNLFEWGDMHFLQLLGTVMGASAACMWVTIYFACHGSMTLIPKYSRYLLIFK